MDGKITSNFDISVPTFIGFLVDVDSPYEVHDYVRSYLGESKESIDFAKKFIEKRSKHRLLIKNQTAQKEVLTQLDLIYTLRLKI